MQLFGRDATALFLCLNSFSKCKFFVRGAKKLAKPLPTSFGSSPGQHYGPKVKDGMHELLNLLFFNKRDFYIKAFRLKKMKLLQHKRVLDLFLALTY